MDIREVLIPNIDNSCRWENVNRIKQSDKFKDIDFDSIECCMNQTPDLSELICTAARSVPTNVDKIITLKETVTAEYEDYDYIKRVQFFINVTPRGCVTIGFFKDTCKHYREDDKKETIKFSSTKHEKFQIVMKKYWEPKKEDGSPRGTYWKTIGILQFYERLVELNCVDDFSYNLNVFIIDKM